MKKRGFTLVELLAVIAILAILVIIALPNVMGMFNNAKKNTFLTEIKKIYRGAEQAYVKDSFDTSGTKVYSKCSDCDNELDMSIRDDLEYYIEVNSQGKVVKFYAHDNSYQFGHEGEMSISDINDVQDISNIDEEERIAIHNDGVVACNYKLTTDTGSFSYDSDIKEICVNLLDDGYTYTFLYTGSYVTSGYAYLHIHYFYSMTDSSFVRVYEDSTKTKLLKEITKKDFPFNRYSLTSRSFNNRARDGFNSFLLGSYDNNNFYVEASEDMVEGFSSNKPYYYIGFTPDYNELTSSGPWIIDEGTKNSIDALNNSISGNGNNMVVVGFTNCENVNDPNTCSGNKYRAIMEREYQ